MSACPKCRRMVRQFSGRLAGHGDRYGFCAGSFGLPSFLAAQAVKVSR